MTSFAVQRARMVERQLRRRGIVDERVLEAMAAVPRERFVPESTRARAYDDAALSIGLGQTISQPWIVAASCAALGLRGHENVLEIGGGSGYTAAILAHLASRVISIELVPELADAARTELAELGLGPQRVEVIAADGSVGHPSQAPYEAIALHAAAPGRPRGLLAQLAPGGRLVGPVTDGRKESLTVFWRDAGRRTGYTEHVISSCRFVPLLGAEGFDRD